MRGAVAEMRDHGQLAVERWGTRRLIEYYRSRNRDGEAARYEERLAELEPSSTAPIA